MEIIENDFDNKSTIEIVSLTENKWDDKSIHINIIIKNYKKLIRMKINFH